VACGCTEIPSSGEKRLGFGVGTEILFPRTKTQISIPEPWIRRPNELWATKLGISSNPIKMFPNKKAYVEEDVLGNVEDSIKKLNACRARLERMERVNPRP